MTLPLASTYWPGITPQVCYGGNTQTLIATEEMKTINTTSLSIVNRPLDGTFIEACLWYIKADTARYKPGSQIHIYLTTSVTANMYVYSGNNRANASMIIEANGTVVAGAPIRVPISEGAIVVI